MPIYVYEVVLEGDEEEEGGMQFEVEQAMDAPPLTHHPRTGQPVRRMITAPRLAGSWSESAEKQRMTDSHLSQHGFGRYEKIDDGLYEKTAGKGPKKIRKPK